MSATARVYIYGDSGPYASYGRADSGRPLSSGFSRYTGGYTEAAVIEVPATLLDEYERLEARLREIESVFDAAARMLHAKEATEWTEVLP